MKKLILLLVMMLLTVPVFAQELEKPAILFGFYHDFDVKESGDQNLTPFIGASVHLGGQFFGIVGGEWGENDVGNEYAISPTVLMYLSKKDLPVSRNIGINTFLMLGPDVTWADVGDTQDPDMVAYLLTATGFGMTVTVGEQMKIWTAFSAKQNEDYATSRVGLGIRWSF